MRFSFGSLAVLFASVSFAACSGLSPQGPAPAPDKPGPVTQGYPVYETFDPAGYDAQPEAQAGEVVHDVPARVMEGHVVVPGQAANTPSSEPQPRQVDGYRIQVFSSPNRDAAERVRTDAVAWWEGARSSANAPASMDVSVGYLQPYYRVRMGSFEFREQADRALAIVRQRFPEAFVVSDQVTVVD